MTMALHNTVYRKASGVPVILLHAFPVDHRMWDACVGHLIRGADESGESPFGIWAPDMPGAGGSGIPDVAADGTLDPDADYSQAFDRLADAYVDLLHHEGHTAAVWVGLSMGGYQVLNIQRRHPEAVAGIALCDTRAEADNARSRANRITVAEQCERTGTVEPVMHFAAAQPGDSTVKRSSRFVEAMTGWIRQQNPYGLAWRERAAADRPDLTDQLPLITAPATVLSGTLDPSSPPAVMRPIAEAMTSCDAAFTEIKDCGHFSAVEHPDAVAAALLELVRRCRRQVTA